jgi:hypothetical protein
MGTLITSALLLAAPMMAQEHSSGQSTSVLPRQQIQVFRSSGDENAVFMSQEGPGIARISDGQIAFFSAEMTLEQEPVKNAPYTATATTESTQTLADGTHIASKTSAFLARDSQGRTRREETFAKMGPLHVEGPKLIVISDPVSKVEYLLQPADLTVRTLKHEVVKIDRRDGDLGWRRQIVREKLGSEPSGESSKPVQHEDLGTQVINGVNCQGRRETVTIPVGAIGNDRPLEITSENWYSPELHAVVLRKHSDPRFGETVYRLTEIKLGEPDASLFQVPGDYKLDDLHIKPGIRLPKD